MSPATVRSLVLARCGPKPEQEVCYRAASPGGGFFVPRCGLFFFCFGRPWGERAVEGRVEVEQAPSAEEGRAVTRNWFGRL